MPSNVRRDTCAALNGGNDTEFITARTKRGIHKDTFRSEEDPNSPLTKYNDKKTKQIWEVLHPPNARLIC